MFKNSFVKTGLLAIAVSASFAPCAMAAGNGGPALPAGVTMKPADVGIQTHDPRKLINTYVSSGNGLSAALPPGFNTIDSRTVKCPSTATAGCHIGLEAMLQTSAHVGDWAICLLVNGVSVSCQYQGLTNGGSFVVGNARGFSGVIAANAIATVTTQAYTDGGMNYQYFQTDYRVYKP